MYWSRLKLFLGVVALAMVALALRLGQLQWVGAAGYEREARANLIRPPTLLETRRGSIRDRNGLVLAEDTASFDVCVYYPHLAVEDPALVRRIAARSDLSLILFSARLQDDVLRQAFADGRRLDLLIAAAGQDSSLCRRAAADRRWSELLASRDAELARLLAEQGRLTADDVDAAIDRLRDSASGAPRLSEAEVEQLMADLWIDGARFTALNPGRPELSPALAQDLSAFWPRLASMTGIDVAVFDERRIGVLQMVRARKRAVEQRHGRSVPIREEVGGPGGLAHPILVDVNEVTKAIVAAMQTDYGWLVFEQHAKRVYPYNDCAAHVVGRVTEVDEQILGSSPDGNGDAAEDPRRAYRLHDMVGVTGVELGMERQLRGRRGMEHRDKADVLLRHEPPEPGQDVRLTLDVPLQSEIEAFMSRPPTPPESSGVVRGAAVVIDIRTGALLALVSLPRYNLNTFADDFPDLRTAEGKPLVHRAIGGQYSQGSIFKAVTATAALHERRITPSTVFVCNGIFDPARDPDHFKCLGVHGPIRLHEAIVKSCNVYFYHTGMAVGSEKLCLWGRRFGFGTRCGLLIPGEKAGNLPAAENPKNLAIGQGGIMVTPLQAARFMALIAADGRMTEVHVVESPRPADRPIIRVNMDLTPAHMAVIRAGLTGVVNEEGGTGRRHAHSDLVRIAGKTGTAQVRRGVPPHAWFVGFAPAENPQIAFSVVFENGGGGGTVAGPVARQIAEAALRLGIITPSRTARQ
ncbi:MAG TPA: penicillin-binding transpeptidase domain-containing protein [Phycisphaerae bacterium]|nr:hypothetical protein [Phycisphaerae bacterium]HOI54634.1 penicillin-binding transpeptidase domain-containing protein [Phycisphaerae bacterium]